MDFKAESDAPTPVAMTNHAYWNLSGGHKSKITGHTLRVQASKYLVLGEHMVGRVSLSAMITLNTVWGRQIDEANWCVVVEWQIPTGELRPVEGTPMEFVKETNLGERIPQASDCLLVFEP